MNKYVFMRGYLLTNLKIKSKKLGNELQKNGDALIYLENNYFPKDCKYESSASDFLEDINNLLIIEANFLQNFNDSSIILLHPIMIHLENDTILDLKIYLRVFKNDTMIVTIETETDIDVGSIFEKRIINIAAKGNHLDIINTINITRILDVFDFVKVLLNKYLNLSSPIMRNFFIIDKEKLSLKETTKALCQTSLNFKKYKPLKDFRELTDYYHYTNELSSVVYGNNLKDAYYKLLMLDHFIIYLILKDLRDFNKIKKNKYSLKKLYKIKEEIDFSYATLKYAKLVEDNNYICYILKTQNRYNLSNICVSAIDQKIESKNNRFQYILTFIGLALAAPTLIEFLSRDNYDILNKLIEFIKNLIIF